MPMSFKDFLKEQPAAPGFGDVNTGNAAPNAPTVSAGASGALVQQSQSLASQIAQTNAKLQKLMQQKAQVDKQIGQASQTKAAQTASQQTTSSQTGASVQGALSAAMSGTNPGASPIPSA